MDKAIQEGKVHALSQEEMGRWHGPVNFITTFAVVKAMGGLKFSNEKRYVRAFPQPVYVARAKCVVQPS